MSALPSRTRSLRKPSAGLNTQDRPSSSTSSEASSTNRETTTASRRGNQSPSRLPTKQHITTTTTTTTRITRAASTHARTHSETLPRPGSSDGSMRPPPTRSVIGSSRPPLTSDNHGGRTLRSGVKPTTESTTTTTTTANTGLQRKPSTRGHTRNASTSSVIGTTRLPSSGGIGEGRVANRPLSMLNASTILQPPSQAPQSQSLSHSQAETKPPPELRRPAFSTLQQHYSPAKSLAPKPPTASFLVPPSPSKLPSNIAITAETARLQAELLQLHLLHKDSATVSKQWRESAKKTIEGKYDVVATKHAQILNKEREEEERINALGLLLWAEGERESWGLEERCQALNEIITGVWGMGEPGSKYERAVRKFDRWLAGVQDILAAREVGVLGSTGEISFVEPLEGGWREECDGLRRRLEIWKAKLGNLGVLEGRSSLAAVLGGVARLVRDMLDEIEAMKAIEKELIQRETEWIRETVAQDETEDDEVNTAGAIWRVL